MKESPEYPKSWKKGMTTVDILFPNKYFGGAYHFGMHILYNLIMSHERFYCNKVYSDEGKLTSKLIGISVSYERDYPRIPKLLKKNGIKLEKEREEIIFCGGPAVTLNSKPVEKYADFIVLGDAEAILPEILDRYNGQPKKEFLESLKEVEGVYFPGGKRALKEIENLDEAPYPIYQPLPEKLTREFVFGDTFLLEIERSCPYNCSFCIIPTVNRKKQKIRSLEKLKQIIDEGIKINKRKNVTIYSPAFTHPKRKEILKYLIERGLTFSLPSLRAEIIDDELLELAKKGGQKSITLAPEANEGLRKQLNKYVTDKFYEEKIKQIKEHGMVVKLYMLIGIPGMKEKDVIQMAEWLNKQGCYTSINPIVPKARTELEKIKFDKEGIKKQIGLLKKHLKIKYKIANLETSEEEYELGIEGYI